MRRLFAGIIILSFIICAGCRGEEKREVGFLVKTLDNPFFIEMKDSVETYAAQHNLSQDYKIDVQSGANHQDVEGQEAILRNWIESDYDVICLTPIASDTLIPTIAEATKRGIKVVVVDTKIDEKAAEEGGAEISSFIGSDNIKGGILAAQFILRETSGRVPKVIFFEGVPDQETAQQRKRGFISELQKRGVSPVSIEVANWNKDEAFQRMSSLLARNLQFDAVFASNDQMALGALEAIEQAGIEAGDKIVVGFDAVPEALKAINEGRLSATVRQQPRLMGENAIKAAIALANGKSVDNSTLIEVEVVD